MVYKGILALLILTFSASLAPSSYTPSLRPVSRLKTPIKQSHVQVISSVIYHEARGEPEKCQEAVAHVALNRAKQWKQSVVAIVKAPNQFSFVRNGHIPPVPKSWDKLAVKVMRSGVDPTQGALWFMRRDLNNYLTRSKRLVYTCGLHNFYGET